MAIIVPLGHIVDRGRTKPARPSWCRAKGIHPSVVREHACVRQCDHEAVDRLAEAKVRGRHNAQELEVAACGGQKDECSLPIMTKPLLSPSSVEIEPLDVGQLFGDLTITSRTNAEFRFLM